MRHVRHAAARPVVGGQRSRKIVLRVRAVHAGSQARRGPGQQLRQWPDGTSTGHPRRTCGGCVNDEQIISDIIRREGGYVNDPADPGGPTKFGITQATLADWRGRPVTTKDVIALEESEAREIYLDRYLVKSGLTFIESPVIRAAVADMAVNHGIYQAVRSFQRAIGVKEDGIIGPVTLSKLEDMSERSVLARLAAERVRLYGRIIAAKPDQVKFAPGWLNRVAEFIEALA